MYRNSFFNITAPFLLHKTDMEFFSKTALELAPLLLGKLLCTDINGEIRKLRITETECYMGTDDLGCHASKGKTERTAVMFGRGGVSYVYLIYGMHNMFNVVCGQAELYVH